jgi:hypothetical protein
VPWVQERVRKVPFFAFFVGVVGGFILNESSFVLRVVWSDESPWG